MLSGRSIYLMLASVAFLTTMPAFGQNPNHLIQTNRIACHNERTLQAGQNLQGFDAEQPERDLAIAEKIIRKLRFGQMPPRAGITS